MILPGKPDPKLVRFLRGASGPETHQILTQINRSKMKASVEVNENIYLVPIYDGEKHIANVVLEMKGILRMALNGRIRVYVEGVE